MKISIQIVLVFFIFISCSKDVETEVIPNYNLKVSVSPVEGGIVTPSEGSYPNGTSISLLATPSPEYIFKEWTGGVIGTSNPVSVTMNSNMNISVVFEKRKYPLSIIIEGEGTVTEEVLQSKSNTDYPSGSVVKLTAVPMDGWEFESWSGDYVGTENPMNITVDKVKTLTVKFSLSKTYRNYFDTSYNLRNSKLWVSHYEIPRSNGIDARLYFYDCGVAIADFNSDGYEDVLMAKGKYATIERFPLELYLNDGTNQNFILDNSLIQNNIGCEAARKAIIGDYNLDGKPDVFFADHGTEPPNQPFQFAYPSILLSNGDKYEFKILYDLPKAFTHGACSGDFDNDGDLDIFTSIGYFLVNDGSGNFTKNDEIFQSNNWMGLYTTEMFDFNNDGYLDLILGGHTMVSWEMESPKVFWGNGNNYRDENSTNLPDAINWEVSTDFCFVDLNNDGYNEIIVNRSGGSALESNPSEYDFDKFYVGSLIQIIENQNGNTFIDKTDQYIQDNYGYDYGMSFLRVQDIDGNGLLDLFSIDKSPFRNDETKSLRWEWNGSKFIRLY